ncbi:MAG TPA: two-component regulator propeller domain-containing protein [Candidatus Acidoferrales bacterium]|nr:two-component regulator propeller domain-containing protein [Candidatus Acidoferrales bacterium]
MICIAKYALRVSCLSFVICAVAASSLAQTSDRTISQFVHTAWTAKEGAPGDVYAIAQTKDGYLWIGSTQGLFRFDGVTFEQYHPQAGAALLSLSVRSLFALPNGDLLVGYREGGVSWLHDGTNTNYSTADGIPPGMVDSMAEDRTGRIWVGTRGGLACFDRGQWKQIGQDWGYTGTPATALYLDRKGTLWVASSTLFFLPPGATRFVSSGISVVQAESLVDAPDGTLWMAETARSVHPVSLPGVKQPNTFEMQVGSAGILFDTDGSLWITSLGDGLRRVPDPQELRGRKIAEFSTEVESFTAKDGLTSDFEPCIFRDREGSIWVGTPAGIDQFRRGALVPILTPAKFAQKKLIAGDDGDIWLGSFSTELARIHDDSIIPSPVEFSIVDAVRGPSGSILFLGVGLNRPQFFQWDHGRINHLPSPPQPVSGTILARDGAGVLWLAAGPHDLFFLKNGAWDKFDLPRGIPGTRCTISFTDSRGRVWFGFDSDSLIVIDGGKARVFNASDGLNVGSVHVVSGRGNHIWIGGDNGLELMDGNRFLPVQPADYESFRNVSGLLEMPDGSVWLAEARGVVHISAKEISRIFEDPTARMQYELFNSFDGLPPGAPSVVYPTLIQGSDGRLWVGTSGGVAWINPDGHSKNTLPPPISISSVTADGKRYIPSSGLRLPALTRSLEIDYTALSLEIPRRVRFRYMLEGSDETWQVANRRRQAFYTNLGPGHYRFRVLACNNDGVWNESGGSLGFSIAAAYYQTGWFRVLCVLAFLGLLWVAYQIRVRQLRNVERKFREAVETMPAIAFIAMPDGQRTFVNGRWIEYAGLTEEEALGTGWQAIVHPDDLSRVLTTTQESQASGDRLEYEARLRRGSDGAYRWFQTRAVPLRDKRGKIVKWYGVINDIEDCKRAEQLQADLAHVNRVSTMGELTASLAHEIKQPIGAAVTNAQACARLLDREQPDVVDAREAALEMAKDATRAADIIDRIRSLYKKSSSHMEIVDVTEVIHEMLVILNNAAGLHSVSIRTDVANGLPGVFADRVQIQQVLMNLMLNGIQAMGKTGGVLAIEARPVPDHRVQISVTDRGIGLPAGKAERIFEAFFTTKPDGSGMGLAISRSIIESHGGRIWATANPGGGAAFHFTLPAADPNSNVSSANRDSL